MEVDPRQALLDSIRGKMVTIPDLRPIFEKYPAPFNPNYEPLTVFINSRLESLVPNEKRLAKLKTADFALFAVNWWPDAELRELRVVAFLAMWLFIWDDALDEPTGEYSDNFAAAQRYRAETERFLADCLDLGTLKETSTVITSSPSGIIKGLCVHLKKILVEAFLGASPDPTSKLLNGRLSGVRLFGKLIRSAVRWTMGVKTKKSSSNPVVESFRFIADELKLAFTVEQRQNFFEEMKFYIATTEIEQQYKLEGKIPTLEEYWRARVGTSAVIPCLAMIELVHHIKDPYRSTSHPSLKALCNEANTIVIIANDMLSLKKEIAQRQIDSLIPLSVPVYGGVQEAMDQAHLDLLASVARFDAEAKKVLSEPNTTGMSDIEVGLFIDGCRKCWVGNFKWSLCTGRYGLGAIDQKNGSFPLSL